MVAKGNDDEEIRIGEIRATNPVGRKKASEGRDIVYDQLHNKSFEEYTEIYKREHERTDLKYR